MRWSGLLRAVRRDQAGATMIEACLLLPVLCFLGIGAYDASRMVARDLDLRNALAETAAIVLAHAPQDQAQIDTIRNVIIASTGLSDAQVTVALKHRCDADTDLVDTSGSCASGSTVSNYLQIMLVDTYTPSWSHYGIGGPVNLSLSRTVQIG